MSKKMKGDFGLAEMAQEIERTLRELNRALRKPLETEIARGQLTWPQRSVMTILVQSNGTRLKDLSRQAGLAHATVSGIVDRLEQRGLAERRPNKADGRSAKIVASKAVRRFLKNTLPSLTLGPLETALRRAKPGERGKILKGLRALARLARTV